MNIKVTRRRAKKVLEFQKAQWAIADAEHYGAPQDWNPLKFTIIAYEKDEVTGSLDMNIKVGVAEIETLIVSHTARGEGIGTSLLSEAEKVAKKHKAHKLYLFTGKGWKAENFYKKHGMQATGEIKNHFAHRDFVEYCKFI